MTVDLLRGGMSWRGWTAAGVGVAVVAGVTGAVLLHRPDRHPVAGPWSRSTWLESTGPGTVSYVNGPAARVGSGVPLPGDAGHRLVVTRVASDVYVAGAGQVLRIDTARQAVAASTRVTATTSVVVAGPVTYAVDSRSATVEEMNPATLAVGRQFAVGVGPLRGFVGTAGGTLWVADSGTGEVHAVRDGGSLSHTQVGRPRDDIVLSAVDGIPVALDRTTGRLAAIDSRGGLARWPDLPAGSRGDRLAVPSTVDGQWLPVADPGEQRLLLASAHEVRVIDLPGATHLGRPAYLDGVVYLPDQGTGRVLRFAVPSGTWLEPVRVTGGPAELDVFVDGGAVWVNDPNGPGAVVVIDGTARPIIKYSTSSARSPYHRRLLPRRLSATSGA
jgi:hypothetical protein